MGVNPALKAQLESSTYRYGFHDAEANEFKSRKGLNEAVVREISKMKNEPEWMLELRLKALKHFQERVMPKWGADLSTIQFDNIHYYAKPDMGKTNAEGKAIVGSGDSSTASADWDKVPDSIKKTFDKLGIPEAERKFLAGVGAQYDSEVVYHSVKKELEKLGVVFLSMDEGLKQYPDLVRKYFASVIPINDNKFAALNTAVWSGGSFVYIPKGVKVDIPLQAYFRINTQNVGQFERTLIIAEEDSFVHYVEGCSAPIYSSESLHSAVVEIIALKGSRVKYTTIQNWSNDVYNLVTKRAKAFRDSTVEWVDGNIGSRITMKYPAILLMEPGARGEVLSIALAGKGQNQDAGAKIYHLAPNTSSQVISKSIVHNGGTSTFRGLVKVAANASNSKAHVKCDALMLDEFSKSDTIPTIDIQAKNVSIGHEATAGKINDEQLFYLRSRGLSENEAIATVVRGFIEPFAKSIPAEYAVELNRLIELEMEGSVG